MSDCVVLPLINSVVIPVSSSAVFDHFNPVSLSELCDVVQHMKTSQCSLDTMPTRLLKFFDIIGPSVLSLINCCLNAGSVPSAFKHAVVQP